MKKRALILAGICLLVSSLGLQAAAPPTYLTPLSSFGGGDGWLAPGEGGYAYLGTANNERGLAYGNNHVYLVSRANVGGVNLNIRMLNKLTGADEGGLAVGSGIIAGGLFPINTVRVSSDGAIYVNNMTTAAPANGNFRVYRWANELATPTVAYSGAPLTGARIGDSVDLIGSGSSTLLAAGYNATPAIAGNNGYAIIDPTTGTATHIAFGTTPPGAGAFRLGITFTDSGHVVGLNAQSAPSTTSTLSYSSFALGSGTGTLLNGLNLPPSNLQTITDYTELGGVRLLATQSSGDSTVRIWDFSDPSSPIVLASGRNASGTLSGNGNGTGQMAWGDAFYDSASGRWSQYLYAMSSNQGIQAFLVQVPEPGTAGLLGLGGLMAVWLRRRLS